MKSFIATVVLAVLSAKASARTFTVTNNCPFTIWSVLLRLPITVSIFTDLNVGSAIPDQPTGWQQDAAQTVSFTVPDNWQAGRIWGRRDCDFSTGTPGPTQCLDGGCNGGLECDPHTGTGVPPATVAEFTLGVAGGAPDNYDVSLVDGYNLPVAVTNSVGCPEASCPVDLAPNCPAELQGPFDSNGVAVGCNSACAAGLGDPTNNPNCCTGTFNTPETCPNSGVQDYSYFKSNCPNSYAYAFDESSGTALWTCDAASAADYTITFCP
ncbi:Thaumatin-like protein 1 [Trametes pubescens]|uniref:Thaumatin-like protein 1 n=1 Tax=Trametes pubescens TaxID=154538 RepID=A0A1M2VBD6_TRAPU|nr:Thaumatin-like protein 1 [Trametes pubescens]